MQEAKQKVLHFMTIQIAISILLVFFIVDMKYIVYSVCIILITYNAIFIDDFFLAITDAKRRIENYKRNYNDGSDSVVSPSQTWKKE